MTPSFAARIYYRLQGEVPALTIFCYHAVAPEPLAVPFPSFMHLEVFQRQIESIARRYQVLPLEEALDRLWSGRLRFPAAALTFDDGYRNNCEVAFPLLARMGLPAALFVCTAPVAEGRTFWFARLHRSLCLTAGREVEWRGVEYQLGNPVQRELASHRWRKILRLLPPAELDEESDALCRLLEVEDSATDPVFGVVDIDALRSLASGGVVTLGAHTRHHWVLSRLTRAEQSAEIAGSADDLEQWTGRRPRCFAYPHGGAEDFSPDSAGILGPLGFRAALTTIDGPCDRTHPWWRLPRVVMGAQHWERRIR